MNLDKDEVINLIQKMCRVVFYHYIKETDVEKQHQYCLKGSTRYGSVVLTFHRNSHNQ